ncbi:unnamed protein product, partial [Mesorhabditis belari]|uniref:Uncharacterized protein n=1 Tax=Mesorhabditis belari TaxID=2138241 RepID=A0AAF3F9E8_9BILA
MYQNARYLLSSVDDANCQMVVHAAEALLVNATALTDLPTEASRELLKRDDWYTVASYLNGMIGTRWRDFVE